MAATSDDESPSSNTDSAQPTADSLAGVLPPRNLFNLIDALERAREQFCAHVAPDRPVASSSPPSILQPTDDRPTVPLARPFCSRTFRLTPLHVGGSRGTLICIHLPSTFSRPRPGARPGHPPSSDLAAHCMSTRASSCRRGITSYRSGRRNDLLIAVQRVWCPDPVRLLCDAGHGSSPGRLLEPRRSHRHSG